MKAKSPNMMSWLRQVFQRSPGGEAGEGGAENPMQVRNETRPAAPQPASAPASEPVLLSRLRRSREALAPVAAQSPSVATAVRALRRLEIRLTRLPRVVILGEFNSGKSSLVNILLGSDFVPGPLTRKGRFPC